MQEEQDGADAVDPTEKKKKKKKNQQTEQQDAAAVEGDCTYLLAVGLKNHHACMPLQRCNVAFPCNVVYINLGFTFGRL